MQKRKDLPLSQLQKTPHRVRYQLWLSHHSKSTCPAQPLLHSYLCSFSGNSQARDIPQSAAYVNLPGSPSCRPRSTHGSFSPPYSASLCCSKAQPFRFSSAAIFTCKFKEEKAAEKNPTANSWKPGSEETNCLCFYCHTCCWN